MYSSSGEISGSRAKAASGSSGGKASLSGRSAAGTISSVIPRPRKRLSRGETGLVGGVGSVLGIALGAVALTQIKRSPQDGRGPALAAILVGIATLLVSFVLRAFALSI